MINDYLKYIQEDDKQLNEFILLPMILLSAKIYKKYAEHKKIARYCLGKMGDKRKKCFIIYKINAIKKTIIEVKKFKPTCKKWSTNIPKCISNIDKEVIKLQKEIRKLKIKLAKI